MPEWRRVYRLCRGIYLRLRCRILGIRQLDYEGELVIVIGKRGRNIKAEDALEHVFGWTVANDVSARHWQRQAGGNQIIIGKGFDTHCPLGPVLVTTEEILTLTGSGP